jgi:hypothetical protein
VQLSTPVNRSLTSSSFPLQGTLLAQRLDPGTAQLSGDPTVIAQGIGTNGASARAFSAASSDIAYASGSTPSRLIWFNRSGRQTGSISTPGGGEFLDPEISPDGTTGAPMGRNCSTWISRAN